VVEFDRDKFEIIFVTAPLPSKFFIFVLSEAETLGEAFAEMELFSVVLAETVAAGFAV